jgi:hypothetical protein
MSFIDLIQAHADGGNRAPHKSNTCFLAFRELFSDKITFIVAAHWKVNFLRRGVLVTDDLVPLRLSVGNIAVVFKSILPTRRSIQRGEGNLGGGNPTENSDGDYGSDPT